VIKKNGVVISTLAQWEELAGPKREHQWSPERSAYETARTWLSVQPPALPRQITAALLTNSAFGAVTAWTAEPEARVPFDTLKGEPRNTDLLVHATDEYGDLVLAIEAKADEPFGETVTDAMAAALERRVANHNSRGVERIVSLVQSLFGERSRGQQEVATLRYQLLTATAGALAAATRANASRVVMLVQEFRTAKTTDEKHVENAKDLDAFVHRLSQGSVSSCVPGKIVGPFSIPGAPLFEKVPQLYIGKVSHDMRARTADEAVEAALRALGGERSVADVT